MRQRFFKRCEPSVPQRLLCPPTRASDMTPAKRGTSCRVVTGLNSRRVTQQNAGGPRNKTTEKLFFRGATPEAHPRRVICSSLAWQFDTNWGLPCTCITHPLTPETLAASITGENDRLWFTEGSPNSLCRTQTLAWGTRGPLAVKPPRRSSLFAELMRMFRFRFTFLPISLFLISREQVLFTLRHLFERLS